MAPFRNSTLNEIYDRLVKLDAKLSDPVIPPAEAKPLTNYDLGVSNNAAHFGKSYVWLDKALTGLVGSVSMGGEACTPRASLYEGREVWYSKGHTGVIEVKLKDGSVLVATHDDPHPATGTLDYHHITPEARLSGKPGVAIVNCYNPKVIWKTVHMGDIRFFKHQDDHGRQVFTAYGQPNLTGTLIVTDSIGNKYTTEVVTTGSKRQHGPCWSH